MQGVLVRVVDLRRIGRHALTYFATAGIVLLLFGGVLLLFLIHKYNDTRTIDPLHTTTAFLMLALGQTSLVAGVVAYVSTRRSYIEPPIPPLPRAAVAALIPAYNEERTIGAVVAEARRHVDLVIVVDDGSTDKTAEEAEKNGAVVIRHPQNTGYGAAVKTLLKAARVAGAEYAVLLDADGQHNPADIPKFIEALKNGADVVVGNRFRQSKVPALRKLGIYIIRAALRLLGVRIGDPENGFRAFNKRALEVLTEELEEVWMGISSQTVYKAVKRGLRTAEVPVTVVYGRDTSSESTAIHGLSVLWTIVWTWITEKPWRTLALGLASLITSVYLLTYVVTLFNTTRYIRLTYTTAAILLEVMSTVLISVAIASAIRK